MRSKRCRVNKFFVSLGFASLAEQLPGTHTLMLARPASFSLSEPSLPSASPLIHVHELRLNSVIPGVERLDGVILSRLCSVETELLPLFVALPCQNNQLRSLDGVDHLLISLYQISSLDELYIPNKCDYTHVCV